MSKRAALICCGALLTASVAWGAATLDVKTGLWEMTSVGETSGRPPIPAEALAKLTPEQRAKVEQSMAAGMASANQPRVRKECLTQKSLERGLNFEDRPNCRTTVLNSTPRMVDFAMECTGAQQMKGKFHFEAADRETIAGDTNMMMTDGTNTMTMKYKISGKWLGSNCGDVKPSGE